MWIAQFVVFVLVLAAIVYVAVKIADMANATRKGRWITGLSVGIVAFLILNIPNWRLLIGRIYFDHLCKTEAGEFIYRTVENVEGLYQMRPRDPKDYIDRMRDGDVPEDPFGHTNEEAQRPQFLFVGPPANLYRFFENDLPQGGNKTPSAPVVLGEVEPNAKFRRYRGYEYREGRPMIEDHVAALHSQYGFTWQGIHHDHDALFGIYGGETLVVDLKTNEILGRRRGFIFRNSGGGICPPDKTDQSLYRFVSRVLIPVPFTSGR